MGLRARWSTGREGLFAEKSEQNAGQIGPDFRQPPLKALCGHFQGGATYGVSDGNPDTPRKLQTTPERLERYKQTRFHPWDLLIIDYLYIKTAKRLVPRNNAHPATNLQMLNTPLTKLPRISLRRIA